MDPGEETGAAARFASVEGRWLVNIASVAALLALTALLCADFVADRARVASDFKSFYLAGRALRLGLDAYDPAVLAGQASELGLGRAYPYLYPPLLASLLAPLSTLPAAAIQWGWSIGSVAAIGLSTALLVVEGSRGQQARKENAHAANKHTAAMTVWAALLLLALPVRNNVSMGQVNPFVLGFATGALVLARRQRFAWAGGLLAIATLLKLSPALLLIPLLSLERRRTLVGYASGLALGFSLSLGLTGPEPWLRFPAHATHILTADTIDGLFALSHASNFSMRGAWLRLLPTNPLAARVVASSLVALGIALLVRACARTIRGRRDWVGAPLGALALMVVASPLTYVHHVLYLLPGLLLLMQATQEPDRNGWPRVSTRGLLLLGLTAVAAYDLPRFLSSNLLARGPLQPALSATNLAALVGIFAVSLSAGAGARVAAPLPQRHSPLTDAAPPASG